MMQLRSNQRKKLNCTFLALTLREVIPLKKNGSKFSHLLTVRADGAEPPPPYSQLDRKISIFYDFP